MTALLADRPTTEETAVTATMPDTARPQTKRQRKIRKNPPVANDPAQNFRCNPDAWLLFDDSVRAMKTNRSAYLRDVIDWVNHVPGATRPERPRLEQLHDIEYLREQDEKRKAARLDGAA